jgi:5-methylcytosine-specific restriction endonuclease McrA
MTWYVAVYLHSKWWRKRRRAAFRAARSRCQLCGAKATEVHHLSYDHLWSEPDNELLVLCLKCHAAIHGKRPRRKKGKKKFRKYSGKA